ncbi:unnamed protein product [Caenorhabditis angaria]|uniref:Major facilitator superfamily (MFS) profile domain-containing protein n=1 Tax=Caenorhabditis angaria TaxID=860376 RepID=A0A9P1MYQ7_9PELO|nr:unnamed protein product [Caenorhabditis angaria]
MAGGSPSAGCCCCLNNVRFLILFLTTFAISAMYSNVILFNLTSILHTDLEDNSRPVAGLVSIHEYTTWHGRKKRESEPNFDEGHPILPSTTTKPTTTTLPLITRKKTEKPKTIFITNSAPVLTTTTPLPTTTEYDVVKAEVEKSLKKLKEAEDYPSKVAEEENVDNKAPKPEFTQKISRTILYAAPGFGVLIGLLVTIQLTKKVETRKIFGLFLLISGCLSCSIPFAVHLGYFVLFTLRFLQGILFSIVFPVMGNVLINWGPLKEQLFFISTMFMFVSFGSFVSWPFTMLLHSNEVPLYILYAIHASSLFLFALIWIIFYRDRPEQHPWVSGVELNKIVAGKVQELQSKRTPSDSYACLLKSLSAWSIWISAFGFFSTTAFFAIYIPSFLSSQDVFVDDYLGIFSGLPFLPLPLFCVLIGITVRFAHPSTKLVRILNTTGFAIEALVVLAIPAVVYSAEQNSPLLILSIATIPLSLSIVGGFLKSLTIVGRVFAKQIVAICGVSFAIAFIILPIVVNSVVEQNSLADWTKVFMALVFILLVVAVEFAVFGRGRSASWAESSWDPLVASTKMQSLALIDFNQDECGLYELRRVEPSDKK